jgi:hypothetical protein
MKQQKNVPAENTHIKPELKGIEILSMHLRPATEETTYVSQYNFRIHMETRADTTEKLLFSIVHVEVLSQVQSLVLGGISVSCIFALQDFDTHIQIASDGKPRLFEPLPQQLNDLSISTTRGIMFSAFKGTPLHHAILPIVDSKQFQTAL